MAKKQTSTQKSNTNASKYEVASEKSKKSKRAKDCLKKESESPESHSEIQISPKTPLQSSTKYPESLNFEALANGIAHIHEQLHSQAVKAVNTSLTIRNWLIGCYIREYELGGSDRAVYGERLLEKLAEWLRTHGIKRADERELRRYRQFYLAYPQIGEALLPELLKLLPTLTKNDAIRESPTPELASSGSTIIEKLSFTHLVEMIQLDDPLKRVFYEIECIRGSWSVRELKRQIASLYYERSGLSKNKKKLSQIVQSRTEQILPSQIIRDPYIFDFLEIKAREVMSESIVEDSLLDKLQEFLLELGRGFCFEARQKRILIGEEYFFVDLVFYHRILKCHILIELKVDSFTHEYLGQINTYLNWFRAITRQLASCSAQRKIKHW